MAETTEPMGAGCPVTQATRVLRGDESRIDPDIWHDPYPFYSALREQSPVYYDAKLETYIVSRYEDCVEIMKDDDTFSYALGTAGDHYAAGRKDVLWEILRTEGGGLFGGQRDGSGHTRRRRLWLPLFTAQRVKDLEARTRQIVIDLIEPLAERGFGDGMHDIGIPMTARIMCEQLGLDLDEIGAEKFALWGRAALSMNGRRQTFDEMVVNAKLLAEKQRLLIKTIHERIEEPREDMISWLLNLHVDDEEEPIAWQEVIGLVSALMVAGADTTGSALGNLMLALATEPELVEKLRVTVAADDERLITRFVEETLRLHPPTHGLWRVPTRDVEVAGVKIPAGAMVCVMFASANDDETHFPCPRDLDVHRDNTLSHMTFGGGIHRCIGAPLARMEIKVVAQEIIKRLDNIKLGVPIEDLTYADTLTTFTLDRLPLTFSRRDAPSPVPV